MKKKIVTFNESRKRISLLVLFFFSFTCLHADESNDSTSSNEFTAEAGRVFFDLPLRVTIDDATVSTLSLQDAIQMALKNNYSIQIAKDEAQIAANNNTAGNAGMLPDVSLNASAEKAEHRAETWNANAQLDWTVFDGLKMFATRNKLRELEKYGIQNAITNIQDTVASVMVEYYEIIRLTKAIESMRVNLDVSRIRLEQAEERYKQGGGARPEVLSARVDYNSDKTLVYQLVQQLQSKKIQLNKMLSRNPEEVFNVPVTIDYNNALDYQNIRQAAMVQSPTILLARMNTDITEYALKESKSAWYPELGVRAAYNETKDNAHPDGWSAGVVLKYNLFDGFERQRLEQNAYTELRIAQLKQEDIAREVDSRIAEFYNTYKVNLELVRLEEANMLLARENMELSLESYNVGAIPAIQLRESQRNYMTAVNNLLSTQYQVKIAEIALLQIIGKIALEYNITVEPKK